MARTNLEAKNTYQELILKYLEENASDILVEKINAGKKTLEDCWKFITGEVKKAAHGASCAVCEDKEVYGMAVHYFEEDEIEVPEKAAVRTANIVPMNKPSAPGAGTKVTKEMKKTLTEAKKPKEEKKADSDQMSFEDMFANGGIWA